MSVPGSRPENRTAGQSTSRRRGEVSVQLTASEFVALAVNRQNGWDYPDWVLDVLECESIETLDAMLTKSTSRFLWRTA